MIKALIIAGASAAGKTTVAHKLIEEGGFELVRSLTTRGMRSDSYGAEYIYTDREGFLRLLSEGGVLEYTEYSGNLYGTPRSEIERIASSGKTPILILDLNGVRSLASAEGIEPCSIYLYGSLNVLETRLYERYIGDTPTAEGLASFVLRKEQNITDYLSAEDVAPYFYRFVRGDVSLPESTSGVRSAFSDFLSRVPRDGEKISVLARELFEEAVEKRR